MMNFFLGIFVFSNFLWKRKLVFRTKNVFKMEPECFFTGEE